MFVCFLNVFCLFFLNVGLSFCLRFVNLFVWKEYICFLILTTHRKKMKENTKIQIRKVQPNQQKQIKPNPTCSCVDVDISAGQSHEEQQQRLEC